jgi:multisubunit Na+/H+ antiporter MnhB subunit
MIELHILIVFMIIGAIIALEVRDLLSSVIAVGAVGLALSLCFLILKAPDLAITQFVVEIVAVIILIRATMSRDLASPTNGRMTSRLIGLGFVALFMIVGFWCFSELPEFGHPTMRVAQKYLADGKTETGATNMVAAVILDYRAYDTLGEATVLFAAVMSVLAIVRRVGRKSDPEAALPPPQEAAPLPEAQQGMSVIVKTITRLTVGMIFVYGVYIILHGHVSPGGGFAGGVIVALSFIHLMLAYGKNVAFRKLTYAASSLLESVGALMFLGIALLGFLGGRFFLNVIPKGQPFHLFSAGIIPLCNIAICLEVGAGLFAMFVALVFLRIRVEKRS